MILSSADVFQTLKKKKKNIGGKLSECPVDLVWTKLIAKITSKPNSPLAGKELSNDLQTFARATHIGLIV